MTTHRMPFNLQTREQIVSRVLVTLILKQKITKKITFPIQYNGNIKSMNSFRWRGGGGRGWFKDFHWQCWQRRSYSCAVSGMVICLSFGQAVTYLQIKPKHNTPITLFLSFEIIVNDLCTEKDVSLHEFF